MARHRVAVSRTTNAKCGQRARVAAYAQTAPPLVGVRRHSALVSARLFCLQRGDQPPCPVLSNPQPPGGLTR
jgi:hypothetical protein